MKDKVKELIDDLEHLQRKYQEVFEDGVVDGRFSDDTGVNFTVATQAVYIAKASIKLVYNSLNEGDTN